jgi:lysozyme family protein
MRIHLIRSIFAIILFAISISAPAHAADIQKTLAVIYGHEGGLQCDRDDPGNWTGGRVGIGHQGCTKYGIATNTYPNEDIRHLTLKSAGELYKRDFWNPLHLGELKSQGLATEIMDTAVNCGVGTAARIVSRCCNHLNGRGTDFPVNSTISPETIWWLNEYSRSKPNRLRFYKLLNGYQLGRYIDIANKNPKMEKYLNSWLSRVNW